jgi:hypothetical protein
MSALFRAANLRKPSRTRRLGPGGNDVSHRSVCSEAKIFVFKIERCVFQFARPGGPQNSHCFWIAEQIEGLGNCLPTLPGDEIKNRFVAPANGDCFRATQQPREGRLSLTDANCRFRLQVT